MERVLKNASSRITVVFGNGHLGVDLGYNGEDTVYAHSDGKVVECVSGRKKDNNTSGMDTYGNYVTIEHPNGYFTRYAHLSDVYVKLGDDVVGGQKVGEMGESGNTFGKHLHFEVRGKGRVVKDPTPYLDKDLPNMPTKEEPTEKPKEDNKPKKSLDEIAKDVIAGKYGTQNDKPSRKERLEAEGYNFAQVQNRVNEMLNGTSTKTTQYTVKFGDNLSTIAQKYGTTVNRLIELNRAKYPLLATSNGNYIQVGWTITIG